jgi:hypothetical protein
VATNPLGMGAIALAGVNAALLLTLSGVWFRNYRRFESGMVLGLLVFSVALLVENLVAVYFFFNGMHMLYAPDPLVGNVVVVMRTLEFVAVAFLASVTLR